MFLCIIPTLFTSALFPYPLGTRKAASYMRRSILCPDFSLLRDKSVRDGSVVALKIKPEFLLNGRYPYRILDGE